MFKHLGNIGIASDFPFGLPPEVNGLSKGSQVSVNVLEVKDIGSV